MTDKPIGSTWLKQKYELYNHTITHKSYIGTRSKIETDENGHVIEIYPPHYYPRDTTLHHVEFALKYDDLNLYFLKEIFSRVNEEEFIESVVYAGETLQKRSNGIHVIPWNELNDLPDLT